MTINNLFPIPIKDLLKKCVRKINRKKDEVINPVLRIAFSKDDFIDALKKLGVGKGDTLIVHSSYGNLRTSCTPQEAIEILMDTVGHNGNILMPCYPKGLSYEWLRSGKIFSVINTPSSMGILTQVFSDQNEVKKSLHPIKSMAVWGKDRDELIATHHLSKTPYDKLSPYFKAYLQRNSKTIGLGIEKNAFFHCCEDLNLDKASLYQLYSDHLFTAICTDYYNNKNTITTYAHNPALVSSLIQPCEFLKKFSCPTYQNLDSKGRSFYAVNNENVMETCIKLFNKGISRVTINK